MKDEELMAKLGLLGACQLFMSLAILFLFIGLYALDEDLRRVLSTCAAAKNQCQSSHPCPEVVFQF
jgi:hypothetical protein